jgi:hypothetical protein
MPEMLSHGQVCDKMRDVDVVVRLIFRNFSENQSFSIVSISISREIETIVIRLI